MTWHVISLATVLTIFVYAFQPSKISLTPDAIESAEHDLAIDYHNTRSVIEWVLTFNMWRY